MEHLSHEIPDSVPAWFKPQSRGPFLAYKTDTIRDIQRTLSCPETGEMDATTLNHIKGLQYTLGIPASGIITLETAQAIQRLRDRYGGNDDLQRNDNS